MMPLRRRNCRSLCAAALAAVVLVGTGCALLYQQAKLTLAEIDGSMIQRHFVAGAEMLRSQGGQSEVHVHLPRLIQSDAPIRFTVMVRNTGDDPLDVDIDRASATLDGSYHEIYTLLEWARRVRAEQTWAAFFGTLSAIALTVGGFVLEDESHHGRRGHSHGYAALGLGLAYWDLAETDATLRSLKREWRAASQTFLQRHTLEPGTWYGGTVVLDPAWPIGIKGRMLEFSISIGDDEHYFPLRVGVR